MTCEVMDRVQAAADDGGTTFLSSPFHLTPLQETAMSRFIVTPFLRRVLRVDAVLSGLTALALVADAEPLAAWTGLPAGLLQATGLALVPWTAVLAWMGGRDSLPVAALGAVIALNVVWVLDTALLAFGVLGAAQTAGVAVAALQAVGTLVLAELEWWGLKRAPRVGGVAAAHGRARPVS